MTERIIQSIIASLLRTVGPCARQTEAVIAAPNCHQESRDITARPPDNRDYSRHLGSGRGAREEHGELNQIKLMKETTENMHTIS